MLFSESDYAEPVSARLSLPKKASELFSSSISLFGEKHKKENDKRYPGGYNQVEIYNGPLKSKYHNDSHDIVESAHTDALYRWDLKQAIKNFFNNDESTSVLRELLRLRELAQEKPLVLICESPSAAMYVEHTRDMIFEINNRIKELSNSENN
jgi:hypothetical protein